MKSSIDVRAQCAVEGRRYYVMFKQDVDISDEYLAHREMKRTDVTLTLFVYNKGNEDA